ncbi:MAG: hypothetical protein ACRYFZ_26180 [Janthinobacterium lividum]
MQALILFAGHVQQLLATLTPDQAAALVSCCCAVGSLLLQYLGYRRGKNE